MAKYLFGPKALAHIDRRISTARNAMQECSLDLRRSQVDLSRLGSELAASFSELGRLRLNQLRQNPEIATLSALKNVETQALQLLEEHQTQLDQLVEKVKTANGHIAEQEKKRSIKHQDWQDAIKKFEEKTEEIKQQLSGQADYQLLRAEFEREKEGKNRVEEKLRTARQEREIKGADYEADALFAYLWKIGFRRPNYRAWPWQRWLDHWVAKICNFDQNFKNYERLVALPTALQNHLARQQIKLETAEQDLHDRELEALKAGGASNLQSSADAIHIQIAQLDERLKHAEQELDQLTSQLLSWRQDQEGPATDALVLIRDALSGLDRHSLQHFTHQTEDPRDDRIVQEISASDSNRDRLQSELNAQHELLAHARSHLSRLEQFRQLVKMEQLDGPYVKFPAHGLETLLNSLSSEEVEPVNAVKKLQKMAKTHISEAGEVFGGYRRRRSLGLPAGTGEILGEIATGIAIGVAKELLRPGNYGGHRHNGRRSPTSSRSIPARRPKLSRGSRKHGGFKTGGKF